MTVSEHFALSHDFKIRRDGQLVKGSENLLKELLTVLQSYVMTVCPIGTEITQHGTMTAFISKGKGFR